MLAANYVFKLNCLNHLSTFHSQIKGSIMLDVKN